MNSLREAVIIERVEKVLPPRWREDPDMRVAFISGMMVGARVPELGPEIEAILSSKLDVPAEAFEVRARLMADVLRDD